MKKILSVLLIALMLLPCLPVIASAEDEPIELNCYTLSAPTGVNYEAGMAAAQAKLFEDTGINCKVNIIASDSFDTSMLAMKIAAGDLDLISSNMHWVEWQNFISKGVLLPLDDLLAEYGSNIYEQIDPKLWDAYKVDGKTYVIPVQSPVPLYCSTWVRMDLLEKYGFEVPNTVNELFDAISTVVANEPDLVGYTGGHITWFFNSGALQYHPVDAEGNMTHLNADGTAMANYFPTSSLQAFWFDDPDFVPYLEKVSEWYANGALDPEMFTPTFDHADSLLNQGRVVAIGAMGDAIAMRQEEHPEENWVNLTHLVNDFNGGATTWAYSYETGLSIGIVASTKHAEELVKIIDWVCASEENYLLSNYGVEGVDYVLEETEEGTKIEFTTTDDGNRTFAGGIGSIIQDIRGDFVQSLKKGYENAQANYENSKRWMGAPETLTWYSDDAFISYQPIDSTVVADLTTIVDEMLTKIVTGEIGAAEGVEQCLDMLKSAGYDEWYENQNRQYCEAFGIAAN